MRSVESLALLACLVGALIWIGASRGGNFEATAASQIIEVGALAPHEAPPILAPVSLHGLLFPSKDREAELSAGSEVPLSVSPADPSSPPSLSTTSDSVSGWSVSAPALGVEAMIAPFGLTADGTMEVPADGRTVAWYRFTAALGTAGNAVLAAHVDWAGAPGAFHQLRHARAGDLVEVTSPEGMSFTYRVDMVELVEARTAPVADIVGAREGPATLTLITCGGAFDSAVGAYKHRVIVRASLVADMVTPDA